MKKYLKTYFFFVDDKTFFFFHALFSANYWTLRYLFESYLQCKMYQNFMTKKNWSQQGKEINFSFLCLSTTLVWYHWFYFWGVTDCNIVIMQLSFLEKKKKKDFVKKYSTELKFVYLIYTKWKHNFWKRLWFWGENFKETAHHDRKCLVSSCGTNKSAIKSWLAMDWIQTIIFFRNAITFLHLALQC